MSWVEQVLNLSPCTSICLKKLKTWRGSHYAGSLNYLKAKPDFQILIPDILESRRSSYIRAIIPTSQLHTQMIWN